MAKAYEDLYSAFFDFYARLRDKKIYAPKIIELSKQYKKLAAILGANHLNHLPRLLKDEANLGESTTLDWNAYVSNLGPLHKSVYAAIMRATESLTNSP